MTGRGLRHKISDSPSERIAPGQPQQNGRHERLHLTLLQDTTDPPARSLRQQLERFHSFQDTYNDERPHQALGNRTPMAVWRDGFSENIDDTAVDMTLRLDNASALPTCPQPHQQQQGFAA